MLINATHLKGLEVHATDGEIGTVDEFYFEDETWAIRYLVVQTGGWLGGRSVLISPYSIIGADWKAKRLNVALTKTQVENSPDIDTHQPGSRASTGSRLQPVLRLSLLLGRSFFVGPRARPRPV